MVLKPHKQRECVFVDAAYVDSLMQEVGYNLIIKRPTSCLHLTQSWLLFSCTTVFQVSDYFTASLNYSNRVIGIISLERLFYRFELISKFNVGLKSLLHKGISGPEFYGDLVHTYKFKKIMGGTDFSDQFRKIIMRHKRTSYDLNAIRQSACLVINPITVDNFAALFNCTPVDRASDSLITRPKAIHFSWLGPELFVCCLVHRGSPGDLLCFRFPLALIDRPRISIYHATRCILSSHRLCLCFFIVLRRDSCVYRDDSLTS